MNFVPIRYRIEPFKYEIEIVLKDDSGPESLWRWAVQKTDKTFLCLNRDLEWEYQPQPSSRDEAFLKRCRFTLNEAKGIVKVLIEFMDGTRPELNMPHDWKDTPKRDKE
jgi:hypothetical protein